MGLSVSAYAHAGLVPVHLALGECGEHPSTRTDIRFLLTQLGLEFGRCYEGWGAEFLFYAGSYRSYAAWADILALRALGVRACAISQNPIDYVLDGPFFVLLYLADVRGTFGPGAAAHLAADFRDLRAKVLSQPLGDPKDEAWFIERYDNFERAFDLAASGNGMVVFC